MLIKELSGHIIMKFVILLSLLISTLLCTSHSIYSQTTTDLPVRTATYEDDIVFVTISLEDISYTPKDTAYINLAIENKLPKPIFIPTRFYDADILLPQNVSNFGFDLGMGGYFDSDPLLSMKAIPFTEVSKKTERKISIPISNLLADRENFHKKYFEISVYLALIENINDLENFVKSDDPDLLSNDQFIVFSNRVSELHVGPLGMMIKLEEDKN